MARTAFVRRFSGLVGESPLAYLTRWCMMLSARLLREIDLSLDTIAARVGYGSVFSLSKALSRARGAPPDRHRRAQYNRSTRTTCNEKWW